jgi:hypothetical protein
VRRLRAACALLALCLALGCRGAPPLRPLAADDPRPDALLAAWAQQAGERRALRGTARLAVDADGAGLDGRDLHLRSRQALVLARPARLRVEVRSLLGTTAAVLATDGADYDFFRADDHSFESGPVHDALLWEVARLALTPEEVVDLVLGPPQLAGALAPAAAFDAGDGRVRIALADASGSVRRQVDFDAAGRLRWLQQRRRDGAVAWEAAFDDYAAVNGAAVAHSLAIELGGGRTRALLSLSGVELNPALSPDIFRLDDLAAREAQRGDGG